MDAEFKGHRKECELVVRQTGLPWQRAGMLTERTEERVTSPLSPSMQARMGSQVADGRTKPTAQQASTLAQKLVAC